VKLAPFPRNPDGTVLQTSNIQASNIIDWQNITVLTQASQLTTGR